MIRLRVLGPLELVDGSDREVRSVLTQPKRLAILAYLAASERGFHRRDALLAMFWPELDEARGRAALNSSIRFLRRELGPDVIVSRGADEVGIDRRECWCDADVFRAFAHDGHHAQVLDLYRGDMMPGFHADAGLAFEDWLQHERATLRECAAKAAKAIACERERDGDMAGAISYSQRAVGLSNFDERIVRRLLELHDRVGDRTSALFAYDAFASHVASEFGATPAPETQLLIERIRNRQAIQEPETRTPGSSVPRAEPPRLAPHLEERPSDPQPDPRRAFWARASIAATLGAFTLAAVALSRGNPPTKSITVGTTRLVSTAPELELEPTISPDGDMVAYAAGPLGATRIYARSIAGGAPVLLSGSIPGDHRWPRWSPDGRQILFVAKPSISPPTGALYIVAALGGTPTLLSDADEPVATPAWSPDGKSVAYSTGEHIVVRSLAGGPPKRIVSGSEIHSPAFSPDGRFLAYVEGDHVGESVLNTSPSALSIVSIDGGAPRQLTDLTHSNRSPVWSADGRSVLYLSNADGASDVYQQRVTADGAADGPPVRITTALGAATMALSANGQTLVYSVVRRRTQIWSAPIHPSAETRLDELTLLTRELQSIEGLDISRDGKWLVYDSDRSGNQDIYKVAVGGGEPIQLTHDPTPEYVPQWSYDGTEIAYYSLRTGNRDVRVMSSEGRDDHALTDGPTEELYPAWSPDGNALVFMRRAKVPDTGALMVLRRSDGKKWGDPVSVTRTAASWAFPRWSPDGKWISVEHDGSLQLLSPNGDSTRTLVPKGAIGARIQFAAWGPEARVVYVKALGRQLEASFWAVPLSGEPPRLILRFSDPSRWVRRQEFATDGRRLYFTLAADEADVGVLSLRH